MPNKVITDRELLAIIKQAIETDDVIGEAETYQAFLGDLGQVVTAYVGGQVEAVSAPRGANASLGWCLHIRYTPSVPADGGVFAQYDTDVNLQAWREGTSSQ